MLMVAGVDSIFLKHFSNMHYNRLLIYQICAFNYVCWITFFTCTRGRIRNSVGKQPRTLGWTIWWLKMVEYWHFYVVQPTARNQWRWALILSMLQITEPLLVPRVAVAFGPRVKLCLRNCVGFLLLFKFLMKCCCAALSPLSASMHFPNVGHTEHRHTKCVQAFTSK
jgi:hypothetical protein